MLAGVQSAAAQRLYRLETGAAMTYNSYDSSTELASSFGAGARLGWWPLQRFTVEVEGGFAVPKSRNGTTVNVYSLGASGLVNFPIGLYSSAFLKLGYASMTYGGNCPDVSIVGAGPCGNTSAVIGGLGTRIALSPTLFLRGEALIDHSSSPSFSNIHVAAGFSWMIGSRRLQDTDGDGVYDRYDRCPDTRPGAIIDRHGCPSDFDKDGVPDGLDRCPDTPPGAEVDAVGCPNDADRDGVLSGIDQCPDTPAGVTVDPRGCPTDADGDGVFDGLDRCPDTPAGATVDRLGCPGDQDNDRVLDGLDRCPDTPPGTVVNAFGCPPNQDSDGDGVNDSVDRCPDTPRGQAVDALGCPVGAPGPGDSTAADWVIPGTVFDFQSALLKSSALPQLDSIARVLERHPEIRVEIAGHAHDRLPPEGNMRLSIERAQAVRLYLLERGVRGTQLLIQGYGATRMLTQDTTMTAREMNRRVEIRRSGN
ncbi:MAG: OmpA family protein [Gemmatimonadales bacterium]